MKTIEVSEMAYRDIQRIRKNGEDWGLIKSQIANSLSSLANLIQAGRDEEVINVWIDDLLRVMVTLSDYNQLIDSLEMTKERTLGRYCYEEIADERLESMGSLVNIFLSVHDHAETIATLEKLQATADADMKETLQDIATLIERANKERGGEE